MTAPFKSVEVYNLPIVFQRFKLFRSQLYRDFRFTSDVVGHVARLQGLRFSVPPRSTEISPDHECKSLRLIWQGDVRSSQGINWMEFQVMHSKNASN